MTSQNPLEQALHTHGDELYQTALLLTLDPTLAERTLLRAIRSLAAHPPDVIGAIPLIAAVVAALPPKQRAHSRLPWATDRVHEPVLEGIARLPVDQRLALDLLLRRDYEPRQIAPLFAGDPAQATAALRDALLALAPIAEPNLPPSLLDGSGSPDVCRDTRNTLATTPGAIFDSAVRGHLATCSACRSAEQAWGRVRTAVEGALRAALRDVEQPQTLASRIHALFAPLPSIPLAERMLSPRTLRIGLPVVVLLLVGLLVLPRSGPTATTSGAAGGGGSARMPPRELIQRAFSSLYQPPAGTSAWHGQYQVRWSFSERLYVNLVGDLWTSSVGQRYRAQLVHSEGGAPYEFVLGEQDYVWYASTSLYGNSIYGSLHDEFPEQVRMSANRDQRAAVLNARLQHGAWGLAGHYLRQGLAAENLTTWGRQRDANGADQMVIGFSGYSPLGFAPDTPNVPHDPTTILLTIDIASGRLREVREVTGPAGGEQTGRTIWRMLQDEALDESETTTLFNVDLAYNGTGRFIPIDDPAGSADPFLPMVAAGAIQTPTDSITEWEGGRRLPTSTPPGIDRALMLASNPYEAVSAVYLGEGRMLTINQVDASVNPEVYRNFDSTQTERLQQGNLDILLVAGVGQRYGVQVQEIDSPAGAQRFTIRMFATGFTRAELLQLAGSLALFDIDNYTAIARLFRSQRPHDPAAFDALLAALQSTPLAEGEARKIVEQTYIRQGPLVDWLRDPYHMPLYSNGGPETTTEQWSRRAGSLEIAWRTHNQQGELIRQSYTGPRQSFWYNRATSSVYVSNQAEPPTREPINEPTWSIINLLGCGGTTIAQQPDGTRIVTQAETDWYAESCNRDSYAELLYAQLVKSKPVEQRRPPPNRPSGAFNTQAEPDSGPYLMDVGDQPLYNRIFINGEGRAYRFEVRAGDPANGELIEATEIVEDTRMPASAVPDGIFDGRPPDALSNIEAPAAGDILPIASTPELTLTEVISRVTTPFWYFPPDENTQIRRISATKRSPSSPLRFTHVFERAFLNGNAVQLVYAPPPNDPNRSSQEMYIGEASRFGAFLRTMRAWVESEPVALRIAGRDVTGWQVTLDYGSIWTLVELDGTLVAVETSDGARRGRLELLQPYAPSP